MNTDESPLSAVIRKGIGQALMQTDPVDQPPTDFYITSCNRESLGRLPPDLQHLYLLLCETTINFTKLCDELIDDNFEPLYPEKFEENDHLYFLLRAWEELNSIFWGLVDNHLDIDNNENIMLVISKNWEVFNDITGEDVLQNISDLSEKSFLMTQNKSRN